MQKLKKKSCTEFSKIQFKFSVRNYNKFAFLICIVKIY